MKSATNKKGRIARMEKQLGYPKIAVCKISLQIQYQISLVESKFTDYVGKIKPSIWELCVQSAAYFRGERPMDGS